MRTSRHVELTTAGRALLEEAPLALAALERAAESRVPTIGYGMACAVGNVLTAVGGTLLVLTGS